MGVILEVSSAADWFGFFSALASVALGGLIAAIVAYVMAQRASREMLERDRTERRARQKTDTLRGMVKLLQIVNDIGSVHVYLEEQFAKVRLGPDSWQMVSPSIGLAQDPVRFEAAELSIFVAAKEHDFFMELLLISERHKSLQEGYRTYVERRLALTDQLSANMIGHVAIGHFSEDELRRYQPRMVELNTLIDQIRVNCADYQAQAISIAERFGPLARKCLNDPDFPKLKVPGTSNNDASRAAAAND